MYTVDDILRAAGSTFENHTAGGVTVRLTKANQLIGTYADLLKYVAADTRYRGWEVHHIFEAVDLERTGLTRFAPAYEQQICVLIPAAGHHRINSVLRRSNPTSLSATSQELEQAYQEAYALIGDYCGGGEEVGSELLKLFKAVRKNLTDTAAKTRSEQLSKVRGELQRLENQINLNKGLHDQLLKGSSPGLLKGAAFAASMLNPVTAGLAFASPANRQAVGAVVNVFNPAPRPDLTIWAEAEASVRAAKQALEQNNPSAAASHVARGIGRAARAVAQLQSWKDGMGLAAKRTELAIGAVAALTALLAIGLFAAQALAATSATTTAGAGALANNPSTARTAVDLSQRMTQIVQAPSLAEAQAIEAEMAEEVSQRFLSGG
ncbi:hypothetical protein AYO47_06440 [Planctomyces sp. SCGC AG-212-M04]|nr:hypothetical protein AYO47_06440 [Planctomyces sp. SCGC AG-212-M04]